MEGVGEGVTRIVCIPQEGRVRCGSGAAYGIVWGLI